MAGDARLFKTGQPSQRPVTWGDLVVLGGIAVVMYGGLRLALSAPAVIRGPTIATGGASLLVLVDLERRPATSHVKSHGASFRRSDRSTCQGRLLQSREVRTQS